MGGGAYFRCVEDEMLRRGEEISNSCLVLVISRPFVPFVRAAGFSVSNRA